MDFYVFEIWKKSFGYYNENWGLVFLKEFLKISKYILKSTSKKGILLKNL
jgi:hypothetical protein